MQNRSVAEAIPLDAELAEVLWTWKLKAPYNQPEDWVFASRQKKGSQPYWLGSLYRAHVKPALDKAGIKGTGGLAYVATHFWNLDESKREDAR
jgi:integrase